MNKYRKLVTEFDCDHSHVCKIIEMDGCFRCASYSPYHELMIDLGRAKDYEKQDLIIDFLEAHDETQWGKLFK